MGSSVTERVHALIRAVPPGPVSARNRALLVLLAAGGLRLEEAQRLRLGDVRPDDGTVTVIAAGGAEPEVVAKNPKLGERVAATPAIADDTLYVRTAGHLYAFAEKK